MKLTTDNFLVVKHWFDEVRERCTKEQLYTLYVAVLEYGLYGNDITEEISDGLLASMFLEIKNQIDIMKDSYERRQEKGHILGRPSTYTKEENVRIYELARKGYSARMIANELGAEGENKRKAIYNSEGWKNKNVENFY